MTVTVSRAMWQQGSETLKRLLAAAGARHVDNIVDHPPRLARRDAGLDATSAPFRARTAGWLGVFPEAGVAEERP